MENMQNSFMDLESLEREFLDDLQHENHCAAELKARYNNIPLVEFYELYVGPEDIPHTEETCPEACICV